MVRPLDCRIWPYSASAQHTDTMINEITCMILKIALNLFHSISIHLQLRLHGLKGRGQHLTKGEGGLYVCVREGESRRGNGEANEFSFPVWSHIAKTNMARPCEDTAQVLSLF